MHAHGRQSRVNDTLTHSDVLVVHRASAATAFGLLAVPWPKYGSNRLLSNFQKSIGFIGLLARPKPVRPKGQSEWSEAPKSHDPRIDGYSRRSRAIVEAILHVRLRGGREGS